MFSNWRLVLVAFLLPIVAEAAPAKSPEPNPVLASALIPSLEKFLGHIEAAGAVVSQGAVAPGMLKGMIGQQLGDPGLSNLGTGPIFGVMLQSPAGPQFAFFVPIRPQAPYAASLSKQGWKTKVDKGLLVVASTQEALDAAWGLQARYRAVAKEAPVAHDIRMEFQADRLAATFGPILSMGLSSMLASAPSPSPGSSAAPSGPSPAQAQKLLALELKAFLAVLSSTESIRWDLDMDAASVSGAMVMKPKSGSPLAALATMPVSGPNPARGVLFEPGLVNTEWRIDPKKVSDFLGQTLDEMARDPDTAEFASADMRTLVADLSRCSTGQMAYTLRSSSNASIVAESAMTIADEGACLSLVEKGINLTMGPAGFLQKTSQDMGVGFNMTLQKSARTHAGVTVHRLKMSVKNLPPAGKAPAAKGGKAPSKPVPGAKPSPDLSNPMLASVVHDTDFAFSHGFYLLAQDPARLDALIDLSAAPHVPVDTATDLLPGANMSISYDAVGLMKAMSSAMPKEASRSLANLPPSEPFRTALTLSQGQVETRWRMPLAPIAAIAESAKAAAASPSPSPSPKPKKP